MKTRSRGGRAALLQATLIALAAAGLGLPGSAAAQETCSVHLVPDMADYGRLNRASVFGQPVAGGGYSLGKRQMTLNVVCTRPVALTLFLRGAANAEHFLIGSGGRLVLNLSQARVDGQPLTLGSVDTSGQVPPQSAASLLLQPGKGIALLSGGQYASGQKFSLQVELEPILPADALMVRNETAFGSSHNFEVVVQ